MLPTFVIGLREGVEAALIVGIVAAFLRQQGRGDALRHMWLGVALAVSLCVAVAIALELVNEGIPPLDHSTIGRVLKRGRLSLT